MSRDFSTVVDDGPSEKSGTRAPGLHFDLKRFLSLRMPMVLVISTVLAVPFALLGWIVTPVEYTARAQFQYRSLNNSFSESSSAASTMAEYEKFVNTEIQKITGDNVIGEVLKETSIQNLPSVRQAGDKLTFLRGRLDARQVPRSELVDVVCAMGTRSEALDVLKILTKVYIDMSARESSAIGTSRIQTLNTQIANLEKSLDDSLRDIEDLEGMVGANAGGVNPQDSIEAEQYRGTKIQAEADLRAAQMAVKDIEDRIARAEAILAGYNADPSKPIYELGVETQVGADPRVSSLQSDVVRLEGTVQALRETHRENHPELRTQVRNLETMRASIARQESTARGGAIQSILSELNQDLDAARRAVADHEQTLASSDLRLKEFLAAESRKSAETSADRARLDKMKEEAAADRATLEAWRTEARNMKLDEEFPARVSLVTAPVAPEQAGVTKKLMMAALGVLAACMIGLAYGALRELLDGQVRTPRDIARISDLPIIASIPHFSEDLLLRDADTNLLMAEHPNSIVADEYRRILARLLFPEDNAAEISSLMVVSASRAEGKTSIASNLAIALEHANRRVLLIDLSSQRPGIEPAFGMAPGLGLAELLEDLDAREELIRRTEFENLGIIGPGLDPKSLAGRLASREMMDFMEWADEHFDHIIIDTPPLLLMSDAKLIAPAIDGVLFVVGVGQSSLGMVSRGLRELELLRANTIGVVLNGIRSLRGGYMKKNQKLFYAYAAQGAPRIRPSHMPEINVLDEEAPEPIEAEVVLLPLDKRED